MRADRTAKSSPEAAGDRSSAERLEVRVDHAPDDEVPDQELPARPLGRTARKRRDILATATTLFLRNGYQGTSVDEIAAGAAVSKQTVYKQFGDKEQLFRTIVDGVAENSQQVLHGMTDAFARSTVGSIEDLEQVLAGVARNYLDAVLDDRVLSLRRLIIAEADRFPDLARGYYDRGPARGIDLIAQRLAEFAGSGLLATEDARLAAGHFAYLALSIAQDRAMFCPDDRPDDAERDRLARHAARVFVAGYRADRTAAPGRPAEAG